MTAFPGRIYDGAGIAMDGRLGNLAPDQVAQFPHRATVAETPAAEVGRVWVLDDKATFDAIPSQIWTLTVGGIVERAGALLLLAMQPEPVAGVRDEMQWAVRELAALRDKSNLS